MCIFLLTQAYITNEQKSNNFLYTFVMYTQFKNYCLLCHRILVFLLCTPFVFIQ